MILYCDLQGNVSSVPSSVPMGTLLDDVVIIAPQANVTAVLRVKPAYQTYLPEIFCFPVIREEHVVAFSGKITKSVTGTAGRAEYQVLLKDPTGKTVASYMGSFNVSRGVMVDMPEDAEDLSEYSLEQIYTMLSNVTTVYNQLVNVENLIGIPNQELETSRKTLIGAINELQERANDIVQEINGLKFEEAKRQKAEDERKKAELERVKLYEIFKNSILALNRGVRLYTDAEGNGTVQYIGMVLDVDKDGNGTIGIEGDPQIFGEFAFEYDNNGNVAMEVI